MEEPEHMTMEALPAHERFGWVQEVETAVSVAASVAGVVIDIARKQPSSPPPPPPVKTEARRVG